jgi:hypothetical protein
MLVVHHRLAPTCCSPQKTYFGQKQNADATTRRKYAIVAKLPTILVVVSGFGLTITAIVNIKNTITSVEIVHFFAQIGSNTLFTVAI